MTCEIKDRLGEPRSDEKLLQALQQVKKEIVKCDFSNPTLFVQLPTIKDAIEELLVLRHRRRDGKV